MTTPATNEATATFVTFPVSMTDPYLLLPAPTPEEPTPSSREYRASLCCVDSGKSDEGRGSEGGTDCGEAEGAGGYGKCDALQV